MIRYGLAAWALAAVSLTGLYIGLNWLADRLWPTTRYGNTATRRPSCKCGQRPATDDDILAFTDGWGRHTSQQCKPWEDQ